ncbi:MAG: hypothetical protein H6861_06505 [Rhodospirillales bacterium]|nr:hypothetical protein [Rhodospirillales bacterium]
MKNKQNVRFITPPNRLKMKAGGGGIPESRIQQAQQVINDFEMDFRPEARKLAEILDKATNDAIQSIKNKKAFNKDRMIHPIMQLKANGGMFKYRLLTDVADICLQFMEAVNHYNTEAIEIIKAHENAIHVIINNDLKGDGGQEGYILVQELHKACTRYFKKYKT